MQNKQLWIAVALTGVLMALVFVAGWLVGRPKHVDAVADAAPVPVEARVASGDLRVDFRLYSPTGVPIGQVQSADVTVRADWEGIGLGITTRLSVSAALAFIMFSVGLALQGADFHRVFVRPRALLIGLLGQLGSDIEVHVVAGVVAVEAGDPLTTIGSADRVEKAHRCGRGKNLAHSDGVNHGFAEVSDKCWFVS
mgnify:CR=1 FL=1